MHVETEITRRKNNQSVFAMICIHLLVVFFVAAGIYSAFLMSACHMGRIEKNTIEVVESRETLRSLEENAGADAGFGDLQDDLTQARMSEHMDILIYGADGKLLSCSEAALTMLSDSTPLYELMGGLEEEGQTIGTSKLFTDGLRRVYCKMCAEGRVIIVTVPYRDVVTGWNYFVAVQLWLGVYFIVALNQYYKRIALHIRRHEEAVRKRQDFAMNVMNEFELPLDRFYHEIRTVKALDPQLGDNAYMQNTLEACEELKDLSENIRILDSIRSGRYKLNPTIFSPKVLVKDAEDYASRIFPEGRDVSFHLDPAVPRWLYGDMESIFRIYCGLVYYGSKYMIENRAEMTITYDSANRQLISTSQNFTAGFDREELDLLFEPLSYAELDINDSKAEPNILPALCLELVRMMDGKAVLKRSGEYFYAICSVSVSEVAGND